MQSKYSMLSEKQKERMRAAHRKWKANHDRTEYYKMYDIKRNTSRVEYRIFDRARRRAKEFNIPFEIAESDIVIPDNCPICNTEIRVAVGRKGGDKNSPTLDKVHNHLGYILGNIAVICKACNSKKSSATAFELRRIADWMDNF